MRDDGWLVVVVWWWWVRVGGVRSGIIIVRRSAELALM